MHLCGRVNDIEALVEVTAGPRVQGTDNAWFGKGAKVKAKQRNRGGAKKAPKQLDMRKGDDVEFSSKALAKV